MQIGKSEIRLVWSVKVKNGPRQEAGRSDAQSSMATLPEGSLPQGCGPKPPPPPALLRPRLRQSLGQCCRLASPMLAAGPLLRSGWRHPGEMPGPPESVAHNLGCSWVKGFMSPPFCPSHLTQNLCGQYAHVYANTWGTNKYPCL